MSRNGFIALLFFSFAFLSANQVLAEDSNPERRGIGVEGIHGNLVKGPQEAAPVNIDWRRSLFVTHEETLSAFTLADVMNHLAIEGESGLSGETLFQRWWDTNNTKNGAIFADQDDHCDDESQAIGGFSTLNRFPYACPRPEGLEARAGNPADYIPIAAVNRLDLAGGDSCGEFRLVFARKSGIANNLRRNLLIFEMEVPNPDPRPETGSLGCKPLAEFWAGLTEVPTAAERGNKLKEFYFTGLPGFRAPLSIKSLGGDPGRVRGQIRSNQFMPGLGIAGNWTLREYRAKLTDGKLRFVRQLVAATPKPSLFKAVPGDADEAAARDLAAAIVRNIDKLAKDRASFSVETPVNLNAGESDEMDARLGDVTSQFDTSGIVGTAIAQALAADPAVKLTPPDVVARVGALTCAGCHQFIDGRALGEGAAGSAQTWPAKGLPFVHVSEADPREDCEGMTDACFATSTTLKELFLPSRTRLLQDILAKTLF